MFDAVVLALSLTVLVTVYFLRMLPLSASPAPPPDGLELAWAGQGLRGYSETVYLTASNCNEPVRVILDLYKADTMPPSPLRRASALSPVAFAITGDEHSFPSEVFIRTSTRPGVAGALLKHKPLPYKNVFRAKEQTYPQEQNRRLSLATFPWDPVAEPYLTVEFKTNWLSKRTSDDSCWLNAPSLLGPGQAQWAANNSLHRPEWAQDGRGQPLGYAGTFVNYEEEGPLRSNATASIPMPLKRDPALWSCGGQGLAENCQAAVVLEVPGSDSRRTRALTLWSMLAGICLAAFGGALIGIFRTLVLGSERFNEVQ